MTLRKRIILLAICCPIWWAAVVLSAQQHVPPFQAPYGDFTLGDKLNGQWPAAGACKVGTGNPASPWTYGVCNGSLFPVPVTVGNGGTGQTTASAANLALVQAFTTQYNVLNYGAKGDGTTDDLAAINAACSAAKAAFFPAAMVYFPKPPTAYLTSTITQCAAVALIGQSPAMGSALGSGGVIIKGKPGQDILKFPDPNTVSPPTRGGNSWSLQHLQFMLDDSTDVSATIGAHRWPGRWTQDGAITNGSATLTAAKQEFTCSDVGNAIVVKGAGVAGADLVTTIASLPTCYAGTNGSSTATLAATASTTVSGARVYTSVAGSSATRTLGNCAIAMDNFDGNSANWTFTPVSSYPYMEDVSFVTLSGGNINNSCAIYMGAAWQSYGIKVDHVNIQRYVWGVVQGTPDTNPGSGFVGQDYQSWTHMLFQVIHPWISYNSSDVIIDNWQLAGTYGPVVSQVNTGESSPLFWKISVPEFEQGTGVGWIIKGNGHEISNTMISALGSTAYLEASGTHCGSCYVNGPLTINNSGNYLRISNPADPLLSGGLVDNAFNNVVVGSFKTNPFKSKQPTREVAMQPTREVGYINSLTPDFLLHGSPVSSFLSQQDLLFFPEDYLYDAPTPAIVADSNSFSGKYIAITLSGAHAGYAQFNLNSASAGSAIIGKQVPAGLVTFYDNAKCPSGATYLIQVYAGVTQLVNTSVSCSTSYATNSVTVDLSSYSGQVFKTGWGLNSGPEVDDAWSAVVPMWQSLNGITVPTSGAGAQFVTGPATSTSGNIPTFNGTAGKIQDSGKGFAGAGAGIATGPTSSTVDNVATFATITGQIQDSGKTLPLVAALSTTAATTDNVTVTGMTSSGHCSLTPTNASAATNIATSYVSAKTTNQITVTHTATASMTYDVTCTKY